MRAPWPVGLFRILLGFYPSGYRKAMRSDAVRTFAAMYEEERGSAARRKLATRAIAGAIRGGAAAWMEAAVLRTRTWKGGWGMMGLRSWRERVRRLGREPIHTAGVLMLFALGIGAATTIASIVDTVLLAPLPYPDSDRLVYLEGRHSYPDVGAWRARVPSLVEVAGAHTASVSVSGPDLAAQASAARITEGFLRGLGADVAAGRLMTSADYVEERRIVVLSDGFWRRALGGDAGALGSALAIDGVVHEVVGVLAPDFVDPGRLVGDGADLWLPIMASDGVLVDSGSRTLSTYGRLRAGASVEQAQTEVDRVMATLHAEIPEDHQDEEGRRLQVPLVSLSAATAESARLPLLVLLGAAGLLVLATCANVAGLFLARGIARAGEWSVRTALGAGPAGLVVDVAMEALLLAGMGAALGLALASTALDAVVQLQPGLLPRAGEIGLDGGTVVIASGLALITALLTGVSPALRASRATAAGLLRTRRSGRDRGEVRLQSGLVATQVGFTTVLLVGAGLLSRSLLELTAVDLGFDVDSAVYASVPLGRETPAPERVRMVRELREGLASVPGVVAVGGGLTSPLQYTGGARCCWMVVGVVDGVEHPLHWAAPVTADYFEALGVDLVSGRAFSNDEPDSGPVPVVVNRSAARAWFGEEEVVGRSVGLVLGQPDPVPGLVVGVAPEVRHWGPTQEAEPMVYLPWESQGSWASRFGLVLRLEGVSPVEVIPALREAANSAVPGLALDLVPYQGLARETTSQARFFAFLIGVFASATLLISAGGLLASLLYQVRRTRREVGIRLALGADGSRVARQVLGRGGRTVLMGALLGAVSLPFAIRPLESVLFEVGRADLATLLGVVGVLMLTTLLATWVPARLAAGIQPAVVLKEE